MHGQIGKRVVVQPATEVLSFGQLGQPPGRPCEYGAAKSAIQAEPVSR